jgi:hypothetical protein
MALINTGPDYTRSGENFLTRWGNAASFIPFIGAPIAGFLGFAGTAVEAIGWLLRGKVLSAATVAATGAVSTAVNSIGGQFWWVNAGSGLATGKTAGTHARALTETVIGGVTGALGVKPTVLRSYTAALGQGPGANAAQPGYYATKVANDRGQNAQAAWSQYRTGNADHVAALENARAMGATQRSV